MTKATAKRRLTVTRTTDTNAAKTIYKTHLQRLRPIDICEQYGIEWDVRFNPTESQLITFGGPNPPACEW